MSLQTVNSLCERLHVDVYREGRQFSQDYVRGIAQHEMVVQASVIKSGMMMTLKPDTEIYGMQPFSMEQIERWLKEKTKGINAEVYCEESYIKVAPTLV